MKLFCKFLLIGACLLTPSFSFADSLSPSLPSLSTTDCGAITPPTPPRPDAAKIKAPHYIKIKDGKPVMQIAVLNRSEYVSTDLLERMLKAVSKQVVEDFAPFYGIYAKFKVFNDKDDVDWSKHIALIIPTLLPDTSGCGSGCGGFHVINSAPFNGFPITDAVFDPPAIPLGYPYMVVPTGDPTTTYGAFFAASSGLPFLPSTFEGNLCEALSHEVLETLADYTTNNFQFDFIGNISLANAYIREVCDPVAFSPGYLIDCLNVANFVLPSYWSNDLIQGPFDFLGTVPAPFTPYAGVQGFIEFGPCGGEFLNKVSFPAPLGDPSIVLIVDQGPVFSPCLCDDEPLAVSKTALKATLPAGSSCSKDPSFRPHLYIFDYGWTNTTPGQK